MVRTKGPIQSIEASGSIGDILTMSSWKGRQYLKTKSKPKDPHSPKQVSIRAMVAFQNDWWSQVDADDQALWEPVGRRTEISASEAYMSAAMKHWTTGRAPSEDPDPQPPDTASSLYFYAPIIQGRGPILRFFMATANNTIAICLHRIQTYPTDVKWSTCINVSPILAGASFYYHDTPLVPGSYIYRGRVFTHHGVFGPQSSQRTVNIS